AGNLGRSRSVSSRGCGEDLLPWPDENCRSPWRSKSPAYLSKTNAVLPEPHLEMLPLLPPLCCSHVSRFAVYDWNLHGENFVQFLIHTLLLQLLVGPIRCAHQLADQCSRIHVPLPRIGFLPRTPLKPPGNNAALCP